MFAFAVWDRKDRRLYLVRDRIGIKPLYYRATAERFSFASELTGLRAHPEFRAEIDRDAVDAFLALDYIPAPHSIYRGVRKLEPGTILRVDFGALDEVEVAPYRTLAEAARKGAADRFPGTFEEAADELERHVPASMFERPKHGFGAPVGSWLTGPLMEWAGDLMSRNVLSQHGVMGLEATKPTFRRLRAGKTKKRDFRNLALAAWCDTHL